MVELGKKKDYQGGQPIVSQLLSQGEGRVPGCVMPCCIATVCLTAASGCPRELRRGKRHLRGEPACQGPGAGDEVSARRHACQRDIYREHMHGEDSWQEQPHEHPY